MVKAKRKNSQFRRSDRRIQFGRVVRAEGRGQMEMPDIEGRSRKAI
jgi:hypothetical protein